MTPDQIKELYSIFILWKGDEYKSITFTIHQDKSSVLTLYNDKAAKNINFPTFESAKAYMLDTPSQEDWKKYLEDSIATYANLLKKMN